MDDCLVMLPSERVPRSIIHFMGGFIAGSTVQVAYSSLLSSLVDAGHLVIATPIPALTLKHGETAEQCLKSFTKTYQSRILPLVGREEARDVPVIGLYHSLGGKLAVIVSCLQALRSERADEVTPPRLANIFLAFNNFGFMDALDISFKGASSSLVPQKSMPPSSASVLPGSADFATPRSPSSNTENRFENSASGLLGELGSFFNDVKASVAEIPFLNNAFIEAQQVIDREISSREFDPSPSELWDLVVRKYNVQFNYLLRFEDDDIDQSPLFQSYLQKNPICRVAQILSTPGNHLTPNLFDFEDVKRRSGIRSEFGGTIVSAADAGREMQRKLLAILDRVSTELWEREKAGYMGRNARTELPRPKNGSSTPSKWDHDDA